MSEHEQTHEHSTHEQHEHKEHAHHEGHAHSGSKPSAMQMNQGTMVLAAVFLLIGILVGGMVAYAMISSQPVAPVTLTGTDNNINIATLKTKVESYVNANLLQDNTVTAKITDVNSQGNGLYELSYQIIQDGQVVSDGKLYSTEKKLLLVGGVFDLDAPVEKPVTPEVTYTKSDKPKVDLFIMSFCPYGIQAVEAFKPAVTLLEKNIDFTLGYVTYANFAKQYNFDWSEYCSDESQKYCSMHGVGELNEDVRQMCIQKYQKDKLWSYMDLIVADYSAGKVSASNIDSKWKDYATTAGVDIAKVEDCVAKEANTLLEEQVVLAAKYSVQGSPTTLINESQYQGGRDAESFKTGICNAFNTAPSDCNTALGSTAAAAAGSC